MLRSIDMTQSSPHAMATAERAVLSPQNARSSP